jgi:hypothetical protein
MQGIVKEYISSRFREASRLFLAVDLQSVGFHESAGRFDQVLIEPRTVAKSD